MSDQTSIFNSQTNTQQTTSAPTTGGSQTPSPDAQLQDLLLNIKNEKGEPKYKTIQDALVGLQHAQTHIQTLLTEKRQVDEELNTLRPVATKVSELEKVVERLTQSTPTTQPTTPAPSMGEEDIAKLVEQTMTRKQQEAIAQTNLANVVDVVKKTFGDKAEEVFYGKAKELGLSQAEINALAARTPAAALKLLGIADVKPTGTPSAPTSTINTTSLEPNTGTFISRNTKKLDVGATHYQLMDEAAASRKMVEELNAKGMSIDDLTKPSNYFKHFGQ